jgi:hypothetical protein
MKVLITTLAALVIGGVVYAGSASTAPSTQAGQGGSSCGMKGMADEKTPTTQGAAATPDAPAAHHPSCCG